MNERIKELWEESTVSMWPRPGKFTAGEYDYHLAKFAELIIREYEQFLPEICPWAKADEKGPMKGWHVQFVARKHFGME